MPKPQGRSNKRQLYLRERGAGSFCAPFFFLDWFAKGEDMSDFIVAIGLAIAIEGVLYALFPDAMKRMMVRVLEQPAQNIRIAGLAAGVVGVGIVWLVRG